MSRKQRVSEEAPVEPRRARGDSIETIAPGASESAPEAAPREQAALLRARGKRDAFPVKEPRTPKAKVEDPPRDPDEPDDKEAEAPPRPGEGPDWD